MVEKVVGFRGLAMGVGGGGFKEYRFALGGRGVVDRGKRAQYPLFGERENKRRGQDRRTEDGD